MNYFKKLQSKYKIGYLVPSIEVRNQYRRHGFKDVNYIQLGIENIEQFDKYNKYNIKLEKYYNKIVTTCSSENPDYFYIKGIDNYLKLMKECNLENSILIAGIDRNDDNNFKRFSQDDFLNILCHSKAYVQLSRFESYNLTASEAKRFKIPIILLKCEGNNSCMKGNVYTLKQIKKILRNNNIINEQLIEELYIDSKNRENLEEFKKSIERFGGMNNEF